MPNRIIRESICTSETIDDLSFGAECTFYRLLVNVDDYGRIDARPKLLKSRLYPVRDMTETELCGYLDELYNSRLIWEYSVDGRRYIQVTKWNKYHRIRIHIRIRIRSRKRECARARNLSGIPTPHPPPSRRPPAIWVMRSHLRRLSRSRLCRIRRSST